MPFVAEIEVAEEHALGRTPELKPDIQVSRSSAVEGMEIVISAGVAGDCNRGSGQELPDRGEAVYECSVRALWDKAVDAWESFGGFRP